MGQYLIDTNVVSDYLTFNLPPEGMKMMDTIIDAVPNLSVITQIELLCWNTDVLTEKQIKNFIADSVIMGIDDEVVMCCVVLRKSKRVKTPDAIIAATALANGLTLITNNEKDFANIQGLRLMNLHHL
jgi:predicted nucleic acid-binding protein